MSQIVRPVTAAEDGVLIGHRVPICDRDQKWSGAVRQRFGDAGIRVVLTPERARGSCRWRDKPRPSRRADLGGDCIGTKVCAGGKGQSSVVYRAAAAGEGITPA